VQRRCSIGLQRNTVEAFDEKELPALVEGLADLDGALVVGRLFDFVSARMSGLRPALRSFVEAMVAGRPLTRFRKYPEHRRRLEQLALDRSTASMANVLTGFLAEPDWTVYAPDGLRQLLAAVRYGLPIEQLPQAVAAARNRSRHIGRLNPRRTLGTTLLVKGLEYDRAVVFNADELSVNELYVAITRGAQALTIVSRDRLIIPKK
jgi:DNA helicase-2/ATP-dependent DNA helicase PcrA